jgi:hypothetical protein
MTASGVDGSAPAQASGKSPGLILAFLCIAQFMVFLDVFTSLSEHDIFAGQLGSTSLLRQTTAPPWSGGLTAGPSHPACAAGPSDSCGPHVAGRM